MVALMGRSPYIVSINEAGQVNAGVELYVWRYGETQPTTPTVQLFQNVLSTINTRIDFNITPYLIEYLNSIAPQDTGAGAPTNKTSTEWIYLTVKTFSNGVEFSGGVEDNIVLDGYNNYSQGNNPIQNINVLKTQIKEVYLPLGVDKYFEWAFTPLSGATQTVTYTVNGVDTVIDYPDTLEEQILEIPYSLDLTANESKISIDFGTGIKWETIVKRECEPKYTPIMIDFVNKLGGWDFLTCFKKSRETISTTSKDYQLFQNAITYNPSIGESKSFNYKLTRSIRVNTGWVHESTGKLIEELLCSNTILVDGKPAKLKTNSLELMKSINGKQINYSLDFEYNYNDINSVV